MKTLFNRFANDESSATAIEYGLIAALIAVAAISAMTTLGTKLTSTFTAVFRLQLEVTVLARRLRLRAGAAAGRIPRFVPAGPRMNSFFEDSVATSAARPRSNMPFWLC